MKKALDRRVFILGVLGQEFNAKLSCVGGHYQYLFTGDGIAVYFQNFNKPSKKLWFRLNKTPLEKLRGYEKAYVVFTNPPDNSYYMIPVADIDEKRDEVNWERDALEVNIDHINGFWRELKWNILPYKKSLKKSNFRDFEESVTE
ncbi:hypothetical protein [uncultured Pseudodesulfovibrio sp.]|uniref:hypothetical protein n=1 Tax=uncultured Pseudodesulfovibrio sp. TaxID=2035858 RepID=UPI0029C78F0F|nr:hypothetical protein [uncultured Pseudodesulfovibrio sp.]